MVREGERRKRNIAGVKETALWLRPETWCHPERMPVCWKRAERGTSIRPLHRNEQDVWTQLCTSQTPLEPKSFTATMSRPTYSIGPDKIYGCLCAGLTTYLCTSTDLYLPVRLTVGLVCQWMCMIMFDYVSRCVYINEIEILICMCWYSHACVWVCVCIRLFVCMCIYDGGGERWRVEK